ncbi:MAG: hypothetical protein K8R60_03840 [Burkholderiales bacterium]|nr:hypothetical protein [Burkholderiales bacterium]
MSAPRHPPKAVGSSPAVLGLCEALRAAGEDPDALLDLLWLTAGHPDLIAHRRVFRRVLDLLESPVFSEENLSWSGTWRRDLPKYRKVLVWLAGNDAALSSQPALAEYFREPEDTLDHPLLRHGVGRHPVVAALWNMHETTIDKSAGSATAIRFGLLQAHLLATYIESRTRAALGRDDFLNYRGSREFAAVPLGAGPIGLAVREFSLSSYSPLVDQLPRDHTTLAYSKELQEMKISVAGLQPSQRARADRYFNDVRSYLRTLPALLESGGLVPRTRDGGGGGGNRGTDRPGFVDFPGTRSLLVQAQPDWNDGGPTCVSLWLDPDAENDDNESESIESLEISGLCPSEILVHLLDLYEPAEAAAKNSRLQFRKQTIELHGQGFTGSLDQLLPIEVHRVWHHIQAALEPALQQTKRLKVTVRQDAIAALLAKSALLFGWQPAQTVAISPRIVRSIEVDTAANLLFTDASEISLLLVGHPDDPQSLRAVGFVVPALSPHYRTRMGGKATGGPEHGRLRQRAFFLPDAYNLGAELLDFARTDGRLAKSDQRLLGIDSTSAEGRLRQFLKRCQDPAAKHARVQVTPARLRACIQHASAAEAGDFVASWLITFDQARTGEARLFYTQMKVTRLAGIHASALRRVLPPEFMAPSGSTEQPGLASAVEALVASQQGWVGCRFVAEIDQVAALISKLRARLLGAPDLERRSELIGYHNDYVLYVCLFQSLAAGLRASTDPTWLIEATERAQDVGDVSISTTDLVGSVADKHSGYQDRARIVAISDRLAFQFNALAQHVSILIDRLHLHSAWKDLGARSQRLFWIDSDGSLNRVTPTWIANELIDLGYPFPANFGRGLLRTELLDAGCPGSVIDALLGHFNLGQNHFSRFSSFDPVSYLKIAAGHLDRFNGQLGLDAIVSRCVPGLFRDRAGMAQWPLPCNGLRHVVSDVCPRPLWSGNEKEPTLPDSARRRWKAVKRHATERDGKSIVELLWFLRGSNNSHAMALVGAPGEDLLELDEVSARALEASVLLSITRHGLPRIRAAAWLRLLRRAEGLIEASGRSIVLTRVATLTSEPTSPVNTSATARLSDLERWRQALFRWIRKREHETRLESEQMAKQWAVAIALSAIVFGMMLDKLKLSRFLEAISEPTHRSLKVVEGFSYMEFWLPSPSPGGVQLTRWFLDPLTELLLMRAPAMPASFNLKDLLRTLPMLLRDHGVPLQQYAKNWRTVIRTARAYWSTRAPQYVVQGAQRSFGTTALDDRTWTRLFPVQVLTSPHPGRVAAPATADQAAATAGEAASPAADGTSISGTDVERDADIDHVSGDISASRLWLTTVYQTLSAEHASEAIEALRRAEAETAEGSTASSYLQWIRSEAEAIAGSGSAGNPLRALRRNLKALLPRLIAEFGDDWVGAKAPVERSRGLAAILQDLEQGRERQDIARGLELLTRHLDRIATNAPESAEPYDEEDDIDGDRQTKVDARVLSFDEYEEALRLVRLGVDPPIQPRERAMLEPLLMIAFRSGARPTEYFGLRMGDVSDVMGMTLTVRPYLGHGLKSGNAERALPCHILANEPELDVIRGWLAQRESELAPLSDEGRRSAYVFALPTAETRTAFARSTFVALNNVLRKVTGDSTFRAYCLRHSFASWSFACIHLHDSSPVERLLRSQPATAAAVSAGAGLRNRLLLSTLPTDRRANLVVTKLMGHLSSAITFMHYAHMLDLVQLHFSFKELERVPDVVLAAAASLPVSTCSDHLKRGIDTLLADARRRADWRIEGSEEPASTAPSGNVSAREWLAPETLEHLLSAYLHNTQSLAELAAACGRSPEQVKWILDRSAELAPFIGKPLQTPSYREAAAVPALSQARMNEAERASANTLFQNLEELWRSNSVMCTAGLELYLNHYNRHHKDVVFATGESLASYVMFLQALRVDASEVRVILRRSSHVDDRVPDWAALHLGPYLDSTVKLVRPQSRGSGASCAEWIGLQLVDKAGQGIGWMTTRAMFYAALNVRRD